MTIPTWTSRLASLQEARLQVTIGQDDRRRDPYSSSIRAPPFVIRHAHPGAFHVLLPRGPGQPRFQPAEPGMQEFDCLLRMHDGQIIVVHLRFQAALSDALPARRRDCSGPRPTATATCGSERIPNTAARFAQVTDADPYGQAC
jgi:hypothetical protein